MGIAGGWTGHMEYRLSCLRKRLAVAPQAWLPVESAVSALARQAWLQLGSAVSVEAPEYAEAAEGNIPRLQPQPIQGLGIFESCQA